MHGNYFTNHAWKKLLSFFKTETKIYKSKHSKLKVFMNAIYWMLRTEAQWRELPAKFGNWNSVFKRFASWAKKGVWSRLLTFVQQEPDLESVMIDSTIVRSHASAAGYRNQEEQGFGRSKGGFTTKIHAVVDALGYLLKFQITGGNRNDITQAEALLNSYSNSNVIADKGYDADSLRNSAYSRQCDVVIPPRSNRNTQYPYDKFLYKERHLIENFFSKIKYFRRIFSRFEKSLLGFESFINFAGTVLWLR